MSQLVNVDKHDVGGENFVKTGPQFRDETSNCYRTYQLTVDFLSDSVALVED